MLVQTIPKLINAINVFLSLVKSKPSYKHRLKFVRRKMKLIKRIRRKQRKGKITTQDGIKLIEQLNKAL